MYSSTFTTSTPDVWDEWFDETHGETEVPYTSDPDVDEVYTDPILDEFNDPPSR